MTIIQKIHLTFEDDSKRGIILEEYKNKYLWMLCEESFYSTYSNITLNFSKPKFFETAGEIIQNYIGIWSKDIALVKVESTNQFVKIEKLKELYSKVEVIHA